MSLLAKMRDRRETLRVSICSGSPNASSIRSAGVAYAAGLFLQSWRYSSSEHSSSRVLSKRVAKLLKMSMQCPLIFAESFWLCCYSASPASAVSPETMSPVGKAVVSCLRRGDLPRWVYASNGRNLGTKPRPDFYQFAMDRWERSDWRTSCRHAKRSTLVSFGVLATVVVACPPRALSANSHAWRLGNLPITVGLSFSWKFFVRNGVKTCCTDSLPHFGQRGWAP